jgi:predicted RNA-binding protein with PUA domain
VNKNGKQRNFKKLKRYKEVICFNTDLQFVSVGRIFRNKESVPNEKTLNVVRHYLD